MKTISYCFVILLILVCWQINAQQIIRITEKDRDGKYRDKKTGEIKPNYINNRITDINSVLVIELNKGKLIDTIAKIYDAGISQETSNKLQSLYTAMKNRSLTLSSIVRTIDSYNYELIKKDTNLYNEYIINLQEASNILVNEILAIDSRITTEYLKIAKYPDLMYTGVYLAAENVIKILEQEINTFTRKEGIYLQFGCWMTGKVKYYPVHLPGFDDIEPKEPYMVDRWQFIPTQEQINQLIELRQFASKNRDNIMDILKQTAQNQLQALKEYGNIFLEQNLNTLKIKVEEMSKIDDIPDRVETLINNINTLTGDLEQYYLNVKEKIDFYLHLEPSSEIEITDFILKVNEDIKYIKQKGELLQGEINNIRNLVNQVRTETNDTTITINGILNDFGINLKANLKALKATIDTNINNLIYGRRFDMAALEFSEKVYKMSISDIPASSELDLSYTGKRDEGDRLVFKLEVSSKDKSTNLENREMYMYKVLPHVEGTVGIVFADPLAKNDSVNQFQMAPSYNILFKGFGDQRRRRKSVVYNQLLECGLGLHISAPDFNKDNVPEIGVGLVGSVLNDYLHSGVAYNIFDGSWYWFFGLRLPVPSFGFVSPASVTNQNIE